MDQQDTRFTLDNIRQQLQALGTGDWAGVIITFGIFVFVAWSLNQFDRRTIIEPKAERVLVVGASSGIGKEIALQYAARGAKVAVMGRRKLELQSVQADCEAAGSSKATAIVADFSDVDAMIKARNAIDRDFGGLDTLVVAAGVSALQPLVTGVARTARDDEGQFTTVTTKANVQRAKDIATAAMSGNYLGPLVTAVTFIPTLEMTSKSPAILLVASAAAVIPAPTRSLYCSSKGASLLLYQSLAIEHPKINFSNIIPGTVEGDFRAGAVDGGTIVESVKKALKRKNVAQACVDAVDAGTKFVFMPFIYRLGHLLYWLNPSYVEKKARKKYNWSG